MRKRSADFRKEMPEFTCPDIDPILDHLRAAGEPELHERLCRVKLSNVHLRNVARDAIKELKVWEKMAQEYEFQDGQTCPWCFAIAGTTEHSRHCPFKPTE